MELERPEIDFIDGPPPADLQVTDLKIGEGEQAGHGSTVQVHYVGVSHSTGEEFDASWNRGEPLSFRVGSGMVISGWDQGVMGMRVGGRRQLVIRRTWPTASAVPGASSSPARPWSSSATWSASARDPSRVSPRASPRAPSPACRAQPSARGTHAGHTRCVTPAPCVPHVRGRSTRP